MKQIRKIVELFASQWRVWPGSISELRVFTNWTGRRARMWTRSNNHRTTAEHLLHAAVSIFLNTSSVARGCRPASAKQAEGAGG